MINYNKNIHARKPITIPYLCFEGWTLDNHGLTSPDGVTYTPGTIGVLEWKSRFYDRGKRAGGQIDGWMRAK